MSIKESPDWLKNRLKLIGLKPINNIVDVTNFVLFRNRSTSFHAFDADEIAGRKIIIRTADAGSKFVTLDGIERQLSTRRPL